MLRIATRASALARWQAEHVADSLRADDPTLEVDLVLVETTADRTLDVPIAELGGKGVFVKQIQAAVLDGRADCAVHSGKDLPSSTLPGLCLAAIPERGDPRDAMVGARLDELPEGALVATGSARRRVQLVALRPDLRFIGLRGNMATRLAKLDDSDEIAAIVVAAVALERLGLGDRLTEILTVDQMTPQVSQGALAVECRADDTAVLERLAALDHEPSRRQVTAERAFLATLGGDCTLPAGAHATLDDAGDLTLSGLVSAPDGSVLLRHQVTITTSFDPVVAGREVARYLLAHGGEELLAMSS